MSGSARPRQGIPILLPALAALAVLVLPLAALIGRANWGTLWADVTSETARHAMWISLSTAVTATLVCALVGIPLAVLLARASRRTAGLLRTLVAIPLVLPPMVGGVSLLYLLGRTGILGKALHDWLGITIPFTPAAVVLAQVFVALPFLVLSVESTLRTNGTEFENTAATLGAGRTTVFWRITLPLAAPGLIAGVILAFARAIGEFGATALFAGNAPGVTQTMPLAIYTAFNGAGAADRGPAVALSLLLLACAVLVLLSIRAWRPGAMK